MSKKYVMYENGKMSTSDEGGGGGSSTFAGLDDVNFSDVQNGQVPKYNSTTQKWENANESGNSGHNYSTTEQVVGTWIDGKPIYEKTINKNNIRIENAVQFNHNIANLGICVRAFVFMYDSSTGISYNLEAGADSGVNNQSIGIRVYPNYIYFQGGQDFGASTNRTWYFTLQYTKTTD